MTEGNEAQAPHASAGTTGLHSLELAVEAMLTPTSGGRPLPTLTVTTVTRDGPAATRRSRALALWGAAQAELMLEKARDCIWTVGVPRRTNSEQTNGGLRTRWAIHLTAPPGARLTLAMKALQEVVASVTRTFGERAE